MRHKRIRDYYPPFVRSRLKFLKHLALRLLHPDRARRVRRSLHAVAGGDRSLEVFESLVTDWANPWSADARYLQQVALAFDETDGAVFEAGSGLTSVICHTLARSRGRTFVCVEHDRDWYRLNKVDNLLVGCRDLQMIWAPLCRYPGFDWYGIPVGAPLPESFGFAVCDGPPGDTEGGRVGLVPVLGERLVPSVILMDDADRPREVEAIDRWTAMATELTTRTVPSDGDDKAYASIRLDGLVGSGSVPDLTA